MRVWRKVVTVMLVGVAPLAGVTAVAAQDVFDWSGAYIGAHAGYGQGTVDGSYSATEIDFANTTSETPRYYYGTDPPQIEYAPTHVDYVLSVYANILDDEVLTFDPTGDISGAFGGGQAGYLWQDGAIVYGIEASLSASGITGTAEFENVYPGDPDVTITGDFAADLNWIAMLRGKVGYATGNLLPYLSGGLALGQVDISGTVAVSTIDTSVSPVGESSDVLFGATAAVGIEAAVTEDITLFAEYGYVAFAPTVVEVGDGANFDFNLDAHLVRIGANWHF